MRQARIFGSMHLFLEPNTIFGRTIANEGFLQTLMTMDPFDEYVFFLYDTKGKQALFDDVDWPAQKRHAIHLRPQQALIEEISTRDYTCFHFSDPSDSQTRAAFLRNHLAKTIFPITSVPHTLSYAAFAQEFLQEIWPGVSPRDAICATSQAAIDVLSAYFAQLRENYHLPDSWGQPNLRRVPFGVDTKKFRPATADEKETAREHLGVAKDELLCLVHGRITVDDKMDLLPLLAAIKRVQSTANSPKIHLCISGKTRENDNYPKVLRASAKAMGITLSLLENPDAAKVPELYAAADIFLSPSDNIQETFGLTILEAAACGLPTIASDWDGYRDLIRNGTTGYLIPTLGPHETPYLNTITPILPENIHQLLIGQQTAIDVPSLAEAILSLASAERRRSLGEKAREHVQNHYTWERSVTTWLAVVDELARIPLSDEEEQKLRTAKHPSYLDFAQLFRRHPTQTTGEDPFSDLTLTLSARGKRVLTGTETAVCWPPLKLCLKTTDIRKLLTLARKPIPGKRLFQRMCGDVSAETAQFAILWTLKHDLLERA